MSEATLEVGGQSPGLRLSVSQVQKFTSCEHKWYLGQTLPPEERRFAKSEALLLGTLMHSLLAAWRSGRSWRDEWVASLVEEVGPEAGYKVSRGKITPVKGGWEAPKHFLRAIPIMEDWEKVRGRSFAKDPDPEVAGSSFVATELPFDLAIPGVEGASIRGFIDAVVSTPVDKIKVHDRIRIVEDKTMGRWGREQQVPFDLQLNVYLWAAKHLNARVDGAIFEAVSTYAYKKGTPDIRFKRLLLDYDQRLVDRTMHDVANVAKRMRVVTENPGLIVRSVGDACTYCDFRRQCLTPWEM